MAGKDLTTRGDGSRNKYSGLNVASIADLKAELYKKQQEFRHEKRNVPDIDAAQVKSLLQKPNIWSKKNAGVQERAARDLAAKVEEEDALEKSRRALEAKTKLYDKLAKSALASSDDNEAANGEEEESRYLVDFDRKADDDWVDYEDSLGRSRRCLRRDLPGLISMDRQLAGVTAFSREQPTVAGDNKSVSGPAEDVQPTLLSDDMRRELLRQKWEREEQEANEKNRDVHYANVRYDEIRDHGAGFYEFSKDEVVREEEMKRLKSMRQQTLHDRAHDEKLKSLKEDMLQTRLELKRLQYMLRPGATLIDLPNDEVRQKAEQEKIALLQQQALLIISSEKDKMEQQGELKLRHEIVRLRDAASACKAATSVAVDKIHNEVASANDRDSLHTVESKEADGKAPESHCVTQGSAGTRLELLKRLQSALHQLTKLQQSHLDRLQRSKKRGADEAALDSGASSNGRANYGEGGDFIGPKQLAAAVQQSDGVVRADWRTRATNNNTVREWDVGKPAAETRGLQPAVGSKKNWKEQLRSERNEEFAPPSFYQDSALPTSLARRSTARHAEVQVVQDAVSTAGLVSVTQSPAAEAASYFLSQPIATELTRHGPDQYDVPLTVHSSAQNSAAEQEALHGESQPTSHSQGLSYAANSGPASIPPVGTTWSPAHSGLTVYNSLIPAASNSRLLGEQLPLDTWATLPPPTYQAVPPQHPAFHPGPSSLPVPNLSVPPPLLPFTGSALQMHALYTDSMTTLGAGSWPAQSQQINTMHASVDAMLRSMRNAAAK